MNASTANKIDTVWFLSSIGINYKKETNKAFAYCAPYRNDTDASMFVYKADNRWHDFGTAENGSLVDLVCKIFKEDVRGALSILSGANFTPPSLSFVRQEEINSSIEINHVQPLQNRALIQYLESRKIPVKIAAKYTKEAYYTITNPNTGEFKKYFSIAFENDKSGYELRNKIWKGGTSPKTITTISGNSEKLNIFEGFIDFLSALVYYQQPEPRNTTIILNSLSNLRHLYSVLTNYSQINLFLDNDLSGVNATNEIITRNQQAVNQAKMIYPNYKDFNEFICKNSIS